MKFPFEKQNMELVQYSEIYLTQEQQGTHFVEAVKKSERAKLTSPGKQVQSNACKSAKVHKTTAETKGWNNGTAQQQNRQKERSTQN